MGGAEHGTVSGGVTGPPSPSNPSPMRSEEARSACKERRVCNGCRPSVCPAVASPEEMLHLPCPEARGVRRILCVPIMASDVPSRPIRRGRWGEGDERSAAKERASPREIAAVIALHRLGFVVIPLRRLRLHGSCERTCMPSCKDCRKRQPRITPLCGVQFRRLNPFERLCAASRLSDPCHDSLPIGDSKPGGVPPCSQVEGMETAQPPRSACRGGERSR